MVEDQIAEIGIDRDGQLYVRPTARTFPHVYRAAMGVSWDPVRGALFGPKPREWSYQDWLKQILAAVADEYGVLLKVGPEVTWSSVPDEIRQQFEAD